MTRIEADPEEYLAQEQVDLSTAPVLAGNMIGARHVVMRVFAVWNGSSYSVLPGGLTRVSQEDRSLVVSMQLGGGSKDTWVLSAEDEEESVTVRAPETPTIAPRSSGELPSRVADNLFWLGRYAERVESGVRLVRVLFPGLSGEADLGGSASIDTIVHLLNGLQAICRRGSPADRWRCGVGICKGCSARWCSTRHARPASDGI